MKHMSLPQKFDHVSDELLFAYLERAISRNDEQRTIDHFKTCHFCQQELKVAYYILSALDDLAHKNWCKRLAAKNC